MVICGILNHNLVDALKLIPNKHSMVVNMTKSLVNSTNILLILNENNESTIKQLYNVYAYRRSHKEFRIEMQ